MNITASILVSSIMLAQFISPTEPTRRLLIFGKEGHHTEVEQQLQLLTSAKIEVVERGLEIIVVEKTDMLVKKYAVKLNSFEVILIGKDGGEKYRTNSILPAEKLFAIIDAMPLRKAEMSIKKSR